MTNQEIARELDALALGIGQFGMTVMGAERVRVGLRGLVERLREAEAPGSTATLSQDCLPWLAERLRWGQAPEAPPTQPHGFPFHAVPEATMRGVPVLGIRSDTCNPEPRAWP